MSQILSPFSRSSPLRFVTTASMVMMMMMMMTLSCSSWLSNTVVVVSAATTTTTTTSYHPTKISSAAFIMAGSQHTNRNRLTSITSTSTSTMIKSSTTSSSSSKPKPSKTFSFPSLFSSLVQDKVPNNHNNMVVKNPLVWSLLQAASQKQSIPHRFQVEQFIEELATTTTKTTTTTKKIDSGSYRTVWSTVTSDNFVGWILQNRPSNVLGGPSWQIIDSSTQQAENIVEWKLPSFGTNDNKNNKRYVHMVGLAQLLPLNDPQNNNDNNDMMMMMNLPPTVSSSTETTHGYALSIRGLEFRYYSNGPPSPTNDNDDDNDNKTPPTWTWKVFELQKDQTLGNGVGTLEILYNDGMVRITKDHIQQNTYIHVKEPLPSQLQDMFQV